MTIRKRILAALLAACLLVSLGTTALAADGDPQAMQTSEAGISFIQKFESFSSTAYSSGGSWYIGYGTACEPDAYPDGITEEAAMELMLQALATTEQQVNAFCSRRESRVIRPSSTPWSASLIRWEQGG